MKSQVQSYEVRCPRCDVSFAPETKKCIHCGGRTTAAGHVSIHSLPQKQTDYLSRATPEAIEPESEGLFPVFTGPDADQGGESAEQGPGLGRSILGSMGSLIWIALIIAFSIFGRACGE